MWKCPTPFLRQSYGCLAFKENFATLAPFQVHPALLHAPTPVSQWTWVCVNSRSWWCTGRSGVLQSIGSQRVGWDWATEPNWDGSLDSIILSECLSGDGSWLYLPPPPGAPKRLFCACNRYGTSSPMSSWITELSWSQQVCSSPLQEGGYLQQKLLVPSSNYLSPSQVPLEINSHTCQCHPMTGCQKAFPGCRAMPCPTWPDRPEVPRRQCLQNWLPPMRERNWWINILVSSLHWWNHSRACSTQTLGESIVGLGFNSQWVPVVNMSVGIHPLLAFSSAPLTSFPLFLLSTLKETILYPHPCLRVCFCESKGKSQGTISPTIPKLLITPTPKSCFDILLWMILNMLQAPKLRPILFLHLFSPEPAPLPKSCIP